MASFEIMSPTTSILQKSLAPSPPSGKSPKHTESSRAVAVPNLVLHKLNNYKWIKKVLVIRWKTGNSSQDMRVYIAMVSNYSACILRAQSESKGRSHPKCSRAVVIFSSRRTGSLMYIVHWKLCTLLAFPLGNLIRLWYLAFKSG